MKNYFKKWFTIIETIIAIIIFWFWILILITTLNKDIILSKKVHLKTQATLLSKQWLEIVYNLRDSNNIKFKKWNYLTWENPNKKYFEKWNNYKAYILLSWYKNILEKINRPNFLNTRLYVKTWTIFNGVWQVVYSWFYYNYETWDKTPYSRYVNITWAYLQKDWIMDDNIYKVNSIVNYRYWWVTWSVILQSFITNWK